MEPGQYSICISSCSETNNIGNLLKNGITLEILHSDVRSNFAIGMIQCLQQQYSDIKIEVSSIQEASELPLPSPDAIQNILSSLLESQMSPTFNFLNMFLQRMQQHPSGFLQHAHSRITREKIKEKLGKYKKILPQSSLLQDNCAVCQNEFKENQGYRTLSCNHSFHKTCIDKWFLKNKTTCPVCREVIFQ